MKALAPQPRVHLSDVDGGIYGLAQVHADVRAQDLLQKHTRPGRQINGRSLFMIFMSQQSTHPPRQKINKPYAPSNFLHCTWKSPVRQSSSTSATAAPKVK